MAKNTLQSIKKLIQELTNKRQTDLEAIQEKQNGAFQRKADAQEALQKATEIMNLESYKEAENRLKNAETEISMYAGRLEQIQKQDYISEAKSDETVDAILQYENELERDFKSNLAKALIDLDNLVTEYRESVRDAENTLATWTSTIHKNYRSRGTTIYSATGTDRSPDPIPVRRYAYIGCKEATTTRDFLESMKDLYRVNEE